MLCAAVLAIGANAQSQESRLERMLAAIDRIAAAPPDRHASAVRTVESLLAEWSALAKVDIAVAGREDLAAALAAGSVAICDELGDDRALQLLDAAASALATADDSMPEDRCAVAIHRARRLARSGLLHAAIEGLQAQTSCAESAAFHGPIVFAELGTLLRASGELTPALAALARGEARLRDRASTEPIEFHAVTRCEIAGERGQVWLDLGRADLAAAAFEVERSLVTSESPAPTRFAAQLHRIHLAMAQEDFESALRAIDAARADPGTTAELGDAAVAMLDVRAAQAAARGAVDDASRLAAARVRIAALSEHLAVEDRLGAEDCVLAWLAVARVAMLENDLAVAATALANARRSLERDALSAPPLLRAQYCAMNAAYARRGDDRTALPIALGELRVAITDLLTAWDKSPRPPSGVGFFHFANRADVVVEAIRAEIALDSDRGVERGFDLLLEIESRARLARGGTATREGLQRVTLGEGELLCSWLPCVDTTLLFVVSRDGLRCFEAPGVTAQREAGHAVGDALASGRDDPAAERALFAMLFPAEARLLIESAQSLTAHGLDLIRAPILEAARDSAGRELGLARAIARVPSLAWYEAAARESPRSYSRDCAIYAAPQVSAAVRAARPELEDLSFEAARAPEFASLCPGSLLRHGADATLARLRSDLAVPPRVLMFITHGFFDPLDPRPGRLVLGGDEGLLDCDVAESLPAADLVVLAACRAALGPIHRGDAGASDLAGAFLFGGSRTVIAPNADVYVGPALEMLLETQRLVCDGVPSARALAQARTSLLDSANGDFAERRRVAFAFRVDGLGHRGLRFSSVGVEVPNTVRELLIGALALLLLVHIARSRRAR